MIQVSNSAPQIYALALKSNSCVYFKYRETHLLLRKMKNSYFFKILKIDLTEGKSFVEEYDKKIARLFLGGKGLGSYLLYQNTKKGFLPLSDENPLIIVTGPLTGTSAPTSGRFGIITKSPKTGIYLDTYCGGFFGKNLKYAGFDALIINGKHKTPTILLIENETVNFIPANYLLGKTTSEASLILKQKYAGFESIVIGPAGEKQNPLASIFNDTRCCGRGGAGAVMGFKNLKAVLIKGNKTIKVFNPDEFQRYVWVALRSLRMSSAIYRLHKMGTANILEIINASGALPVKNFQEGFWDKAEKLFGEKWESEI